jgi:hypothetical protein
VTTHDSSSLFGVWLRRSYQLEDVATGKRTDTFGPNPSGALILHPDGRMIGVITPKPGPQPASDAERAEAYRNMVAYSGRYRLVPPDGFVTNVDIAWFPGWVGSEQARFYKLDGDRLDIVTAPTRTPRTGDALVRGVLSWVREKG